eukprot:2532800-Prymnesium_polylepis.1
MVPEKTHKTSRAGRRPASGRMPRGGPALRDCSSAPPPARATIRRVPLGTHALGEPLCRLPAVLFCPEVPPTDQVVEATGISRSIQNSSG